MNDMNLTPDQQAAFDELNKQMFAVISEQVLPQLFEHFPEDMVAAHLIRAGSDVMAQIYAEDHRNEMTPPEFEAKTVDYFKTVLHESVQDAMLDAMPTKGATPN